MILITPLPGLTTLKPGPAMLRGIFKDHERYVQTYWSKFKDVYFAGDGARVDEDGDFWLMGRVDDVMNVSAHRISTIEVESALVDHPRVAEAAVCGRSDPATLAEPAVVDEIRERATQEPEDA